MNDNYWRLIQLKKSLEILKGQENGTITRTEIDDMNRNIQITKLCYNDGYNEGFQKGKLEAEEKNCGKSINEAIINRRKLDLREELEFLKELDKRTHLERFDNYSKDDVDFILIHKRIKQLQKEIGGTE